MAFVKSIRWRNSYQWLTFVQDLKKRQLIRDPETRYAAKEPFVSSEDREQMIKNKEAWLSNEIPPENLFKVLNEKLNDKYVETTKGKYRFKFRDDGSFDLFFRKH